MKYNAWRRIKSVESEYLNSLFRIVRIFSKIAKSAGSDQGKYTQAMKNFQNSKQYEKFVYSAVKRMVTPLEVGNMKTWRQAAKKATKGRYLYSLLIEELKQGKDLVIRDQIVENVNLIKTLPTDVAQKVVKDIAEETLKGLRAESVEKIIREKTDQHARASARLIARTETAKTQSALTKARCEELGLKWYVWRTSLDGNRVRKSHQIMEGVLVSWSDPPSPEALAGEKSVGNYHAGNIWNCRCYSEPLIEIDDVQWPHKVYTQGQIQMVSKKEFMELM